MLNDQVVVLGFLSVFHLIGGVAIGSVVRGWLRRGFSLRGLFLLIWGGMFGVMPLLIGAGMFTLGGKPYLVVLQIAVLALAILVTALTPDWFLESFDSQALGSVAFGGLFMLVGAIVFVALVQSEPLVALFFIAVFGGSGALVLVSGVKSALKG